MSELCTRMFSLLNGGLAQYLMKGASAPFKSHNRRARPPFIALHLKQAYNYGSGF